MIVKNPTDNDIAVRINGNEYFVPANDEIAGVLAADAKYWQTALHKFLVVEDDGPVAPMDEQAAADAEAQKVKDESTVDPNSVPAELPPAEIPQVVVDPVDPVAPAADAVTTD